MFGWVLNRPLIMIYAKAYEAMVTLKNWPLSEQKNPLADYTPELHDNKCLKRLKNNKKFLYYVKQTEKH